MKNLDKIKDQVEWCLKNRPDTRDNDLYLVMSVWKTFYRDEFINFLMVATNSLNHEAPVWMITKRGSLNDLPSFESIRRTRQKTQNEEGKFKASEGVRSARSEARAHVKEWATK